MQAAQELADELQERVDIFQEYAGEAMEKIKPTALEFSKQDRDSRCVSSNLQGVLLWSQDLP
eukprot:4857202-Pleurochrysis_carterae.AAC.1